MKSGNSIRQDQPIVSDTDYTSGALLRARTLTQPVRTAADCPAANSGAVR